MQLNKTMFMTFCAPIGLEKAATHMEHKEMFYFKYLEYCLPDGDWRNIRVKFSIVERLDAKERKLKSQPRNKFCEEHWQDNILYDCDMTKKVLIDVELSDVEEIED